MTNKIQKKQLVVKDYAFLQTVNLFKCLALTFFVMVSYCVLSSTVFAAGSATVSWDKSEEPDIKGYKVLYGTQSGNLSDFVAIDSPDQTSYTFEGLEEGKTYYFAVIAVDLAGQESDPSEEVSKTIPVTNLPPVAQIAVDKTSGTTPLKVVFDGSKSSDPNQGDSLTYEWDFGDGTNGNGAVIEHVFQKEGSFTVKLTVTDSLGLSSQATVTITAEANQNPVAKFRVSKNSGFLPLEVLFDASQSHDPDGNIVKYQWDFGDGASEEGVKVSHTFNDQGAFTVTLTVYDDKNASNSSSLTINVSKGYSYTWIIGNRSDAQIRDISDTYINVDSVNYSSEKLLKTYVWPSSEPSNIALIRFDLSTIPKGSEI